jgi:hypothetical protein
MVSLRRFMVFAEFFADKIPGFDYGTSCIRWYARQPRPRRRVWRFSTGVDAGRSDRRHAGGCSHFTKAGTRMVINMSPATMAIWYPFGEDLLAGALIYLALAYPLAALVVVAVLAALSIWLLPKLWRFVRAIIERIGRWFAGAGDGPAPGNRRDV